MNDEEKIRCPVCENLLPESWGTPTRAGRSVSQRTCSGCRADFRLEVNAVSDGDGWLLTTRAFSEIKVPRYIEMPDGSFKVNPHADRRGDGA